MPRLNGSDTTVAPPARATWAVASVEPSSITTTSSSGTVAARVASTDGSAASSSLAGMMIRVEARVGGRGDIRAPMLGGPTAPEDVGQRLVLQAQEGQLDQPEQHGGHQERQHPRD